ncbi:MAG: hypothetical protein ACPG4K_13985 [Haloferula sp.]
MNRSLAAAGHRLPAELSSGFADQVMARIDEVQVSRAETSRVWIAGVASVLTAVIVSSTISKPEESAPAMGVFGADTLGTHHLPGFGH